MFNLRLKNSNYELQSICIWKKKSKERKKKTYINFKFSGESKGGQNNKVLETLRNKKKGCSCKSTHPNLNIS